MFNSKERLLAGTILSAIVFGPVHAVALNQSFVVAQAPATGDQEKDKKPAPRRGPPQQQQQQQRPPASPQQQRQMQPPQERRVQPPPQERRVQPQQPAPQPRQVQPPQQPQPPASPQQRQVQPPQQPQPPASRERQVQPPPQERRVQPPPQERQVQPPSPTQAPQQRQVQPPQTPQPPAAQPRREVQPPSGTSPSGAPQQRQVQPPEPQQQQPQPQQRGANRPPGPPPKAASPQQPIGRPAIAPSALQPPPPPPGSSSAQTQRAFVPPPSQDNARRLDDVRGARRESREGDRVVIQEPGRVIVREGGHTIIRHNETDRFRWQARDAHVERHNGQITTVFVRPDGSRIFNVTDENGRLLRRYRRTRDGRDIIIINNHYSGPPRIGGYFITLPPPRIRIPRERYIVDMQYAQPDDIYYALWAAPVEAIDRSYTLDEIRYSPSLLERMPRVDLDTITFDTGSWEVTPDQVERLALIADGINRAVAANPSEVFLIEGHTDAVGNDVDNLSLSDRRAESVALVLSEQFGVPAENLTTQGYGEQYLKVPTQGPERANRRVTARRITPLLTGENEAVQLPPQ